jgi:translation elongation factor EF-G
MKNYLSPWGSSDENSRKLSNPVTVVGEHISFQKNEFAKVELSVRPAEAFDVLDSVPEKPELEKLAVGWPDPVIMGLLEILMNAERGPLRDFQVVLENVWYHDVDSSRGAFESAGRDAGRKIIEAIDQQSG